MIIRTIVTHPGTGLSTVRLLMKELDLDLVVVESIKDLDRVQFDGALLLGGTDINPAFYGEHNRYCKGLDRERDNVEWTMIRRAMTKDVPILGICRGCQMIAIAHGGSLYQDMHEQNAASNHAGPHLVHVTGPLARRMPTDTVNSLHHQSIRVMPGGFKVAARAGDGIIEAIYKPGVLGVQWHPELLFPTQPGWIGLFDWFASGLR